MRSKKKGFIAHSTREMIGKGRREAQLMLGIISYDITDDKRRLRLARYLLDYGDRVQYSVFEILDAPEILSKVYRTACTIIDPKTDSLCMYTLCNGCRGKITRYGIKKGNWFDDGIIVV